MLSSLFGRRNRQAPLGHKHVKGASPIDGHDSGRIIVPYLFDSRHRSRPMQLLKGERSHSLLRAHEDAGVMRRFVAFGVPVGCMVMALESVMHMSLLLQVLLCVLGCSMLALAPECSSRFVTLLRFGAGHAVANLTPDPPRSLSDPPAVLYDRHMLAECRVVREALCMLALDAEIRPCPQRVAGVPAPWIEELEREVAEEAAAIAVAAADPAASSSVPADLPLPHLSDVSSLSIPSSSQGRGFDLVRLLLARFALDPTDPSVFPLGLNEKITRALCGFAERARKHASPWGRVARPVDWDKLHRARVEAAADTAAAEGASSANQTASATATNAASPSAAAAMSQSPRSATSPMRLQRTGTSSSLSLAASPLASGSDLSSPPLRRFTDVRELEPLVLYAHEASAKCRPVSELLSSLQLAHVLRTCAQGSLTRAALALEMAHAAQASEGDRAPKLVLPVLHDPNTGTTTIGKSATLQYILGTYDTGDADGN